MDYIGRGAERWRRWPVGVHDGVLAVLVTVALFVPSLRHNGLVLGDLQPRRMDDLGVVLGVGQSLPLVWRRRSPALCLALIGACFGAYQALGYQSLFAGTGLLLALYSAGAHLGHRRLATAVAATGGYAALAGVLHALGSPDRVSDYTALYLVLAACWAAGSWVRARAGAEVERRARERDAATVLERARIARELHDVVTHHVTAMVVQADAAAFLTGSPQRLAASLSDIATTGRAALVELRHQLGALQASPTTSAPTTPPGTPVHEAPDRSPVVGDLEALVERTATTGLRVHLEKRGNPGRAGDGVTLAVHRVVQESLTNAMKHAPDAVTTVQVTYQATGVDAIITSAPVRMSGTATAVSGPASPSAQAGTTAPGRGLLGLQERLRLLGGTLQATPLPDGGFRVHAHIPTVPSALSAP